MENLRVKQLFFPLVLALFPHTLQKTSDKASKNVSNKTTSNTHSCDWLCCDSFALYGVRVSGQSRSFLGGHFPGREPRDCGDTPPSAELQVPDDPSPAEQHGGREPLGGGGGGCVGDKDM